LLLSVGVDIVGWGGPKRSDLHNDICAFKNGLMVVDDLTASPAVVGIGSVRAFAGTRGHTDLVTVLG
jgi:hypothetical protein